MDVPLPLAGAPGATVTGVRSADGALVALPTPPRLWEAVAALGLGHAVGYLRLLQASLLCFDFGWLFVVDLLPSDTRLWWSRLLRCALSRRCTSGQAHGAPMLGPRHASLPALASLQTNTSTTQSSCFDAVQVPPGSDSLQQSKSAQPQPPAAESPPQPSAAAADPFGGLLGGLSAASEPQQAGSGGAGAEAAEGHPAAAVPAAEAGQPIQADGVAWVPLQLVLGLPLAPEPLNELVCRNALVGSL